MKLSFENSRRILERGGIVNNKINDITEDLIDKSTKETLHEINKAVYDLAEKNGISIWDVCFHSTPKYQYSNPVMKDGEVVVEGTVTLEPIEFEFEKGPGYWKDKYLRLKDKMRELINEEEQK